MLADTGISLRPEDLEQIVASVFSTMLGLETETAGTSCAGMANLLTAAVYLAGEWKGAVLVHCLPPQACEFAGCFLTEPPAAAVNDDVRDVLGELANMIAGNLKVALRPGIKISIPSVVDGDGYSLRICGDHAVHRAGFATERGPFWLTLFESTDNE